MKQIEVTSDIELIFDSESSKSVMSEVDWKSKFKSVVFCQVESSRFG